MQKVGDLFKDLGFNEKASDDVKIAFIKNLVRSAYGVELQGPKVPVVAVGAKGAVAIVPAAGSTKPQVIYEQLSFNFDQALKKAS